MQRYTKAEPDEAHRVGSESPPGGLAHVNVTPSAREAPPPWMNLSIGSGSGAAQTYPFNQSISWERGPLLGRYAELPEYLPGRRSFSIETYNCPPVRVARLPLAAST